MPITYFSHLITNHKSQFTIERTCWRANDEFQPLKWKTNFISQKCIQFRNSRTSSLYYNYWKFELWPTFSNYVTKSIIYIIWTFLLKVVNISTAQKDRRSHLNLIPKWCEYSFTAWTESETENIYTYIYIQVRNNVVCIKFLKWCKHKYCN